MYEVGDVLLIGSYWSPTSVTVIVLHSKNDKDDIIYYGMDQLFEYYYSFYPDEILSQIK